MQTPLVRRPRVRPADRNRILVALAALGGLLLGIVAIATFAPLAFQSGVRYQNHRTDIAQLRQEILLLQAEISALAAITADGTFLVAQNDSVPLPCSRQVVFDPNDFMVTDGGCGALYEVAFNGSATGAAIQSAFIFVNRTFPDLANEGVSTLSELNATAMYITLWGGGGGGGSFLGSGGGGAGSAVVEQFIDPNRYGNLSVAVGTGGLGGAGGGAPGSDGTVTTVISAGGLGTTGATLTAYAGAGGSPASVPVRSGGGGGSGGSGVGVTGGAANGIGGPIGGSGVIFTGATAIDPSQIGKWESGAGGGGGSGGFGGAAGSGGNWFGREIAGAGGGTDGGGGGGAGFYGRGGDGGSSSAGAAGQGVSATANSGAGGGGNGGNVVGAAGDGGDGGVLIVWF